VSVANIDASGPFSEFAEYNRKMVLLKGAGIELRFADGTQKTLRRVGELVEFDGALAVHCELLNGPCVDLNLMVSKSDRVDVRVERFTESLALSASLHETTLVFAIERGVTLDMTAGESVRLEPWDLALFSHGTGRLSTLETHSSATLVFLATLRS
jgi:environmental stress-induced protein Ves